MIRPLCWLSAVFFLLLCIVIGCRDWSDSVPVFSSQELTFTGKVKEKILKDTGTWELVLENIYLEEKGKKEIEGKYLLRISLQEPVLLGQTIRVKAVFRPWEQISNPGQFDLGKWYYSQGIMGEFQKGRLLEKSERYAVLWEKIWQFRKTAGDYLITSLGEEKGAVIGAMVLGEKENLSDDTKELYQRSGISHILAISGLHLMLLGMGVFRVAKLVIPKGRVAELFSSLLMIFYCVFVGGSVSTIRATIMFVLTLLAKSVGRCYDSLTALAVAGILQLLNNPYALENSGFLLSFLAVLGVTWVAPSLQQLFQSKGKIGASFWVSVSASLSTIPLLLVNYGVVSWYGVFLNLLILPPMSFLLGAGVLLILISYPVFAGNSPAILTLFHNILIYFIKIILWIYDFFCNIFEGFPLQQGYPGCPSKIQIMIYYLLLVLFILGIHYRHSFLMLVPEFFRKTVLLFLLSFLLLRIPSGCEITMLDVGQGDGIIIRNSNGSVYLVDGGSSSVSFVGKYRLLPFLKYKGYHRIRGIFLSHLDQDHYNGVLELMESMKKERLIIENLIVSELVREGEDKEKLQELLKIAEKNNITLWFIKQGDVFREGDLEFTCLAPSKRLGTKESNAASMVLSLEYGRFSMLLTGDVEGAGEEALTEIIKERQLTYEVLKVSHHGSKGATKEELLQQIRPTVSLISCGKNNSYGHPDAGVLKRLKEVNSVILDTRVTGAITILPKKEGEFQIKWWKENSFT